MLDDALQSRPRVKNPYPDPDTARRMEMRRVPEPPVDLLSVQGSSPSAEAARAATKAIHETWSLIRDAARNPEVDLKELTRVGEAALKRGLRAADGAAERIRQQIGHIDDQIKTATQPSITPQMAAEIRAFVRDDPKRATPLVREDARFASAILSGPASLSGLDSSQFDTVRLAATAAHASDQSARRREAELALSAVEQAGTRVVAGLSSKLRTWAAATPVQLDKLREAAQ
ncbi:MAG: hypothetical protein AAGI03_05560 [Pseudomonadota bacterium]